MAKRFTCTEKWSDPWFRKLRPVDKLMWVYITDNCDAAGVWKVDMEMAQFCICASPDMGEFVSDFLEACEGRVIPFNDGKLWAIPSFIEFQYGELKLSCAPHRRVFALLKAHSLKGYPKGTLRVVPTLQEEEEEEEEEKEEDKRGSVRGRKEAPAYSEEFTSWWAGYPKKIGKVRAFAEWKAAKKRGMTADVATVALGGYIRLCEREERKILDPERWLKYNRWADDYAEATKDPSDEWGRF